MTSLSIVVAIALAVWGASWGLRPLIVTSWRELCRLCVLLDLACVALVRRVVPPRYEVVGHCQKRGVCCTHIVADPPRLIARTPILRRLFIAYHRVMHNFHLVRHDAGSGRMAFSCRHLQTDGRCGIYRYRPRLCRTYPVQPFFGRPTLLPGCSYEVRHRSVARMKQRSTLPIVNRVVGVHHPTPPPDERGAMEQPSHYRLIELPPAP